MGKIKTKKPKPRHDPLDVQILKDQSVKPIKRKGKKVKFRSDEDSTQLIDAKTTKRILEEAKQQQEQEELQKKHEETKQKIEEAIAKLPDDDEKEQDENDIQIEEVEEVKLSEEDEKLLQSYLSPQAQVNLGELILNKIREKEKLSGQVTVSNTPEDVAKKIHPKIVKAYKKVGSILHEYRAGKLPKAFRVLPTLEDWEEILYITNPDKWSYQAVFEGTKLFASISNEKITQRFYSLVLLPRAQQNVQDEKKLNFHLYRALVKACFRPAAFFKGIVIPLCESGTCTKAEATAIGSVIRKTAIPVLHSSAALLKLVQMKYSPTTSIIIKELIEKRYALPTQVLAALVEYFRRLVDEPTLELPILWHQSLLNFVKIYKSDLTKGQKTSLLKVCKVHTHYYYTPEIRRELGTRAQTIQKQQQPLPESNEKKKEADGDEMKID